MSSCVLNASFPGSQTSMKLLSSLLRRQIQTDLSTAMNLTWPGSLTTGFGEQIKLKMRAKLSLIFYVLTSQGSITYYKN